MQKKQILDAFARALDELGDAPKKLKLDLDIRDIDNDVHLATISLKDGEVQYFKFVTRAHKTRVDQANRELEMQLDDEAFGW